MTEAVVDLLKHLRTMHATLATVCFVGLYATLSAGESPRTAREVRTLRSTASLAIANPEALLIQYQPAWLNERAERIHKDLQRHVHQQFPLQWSRTAQDSTQVRLLRAVAPRPAMNLGEANLEDLRAVLETRPARVEYMAHVDSCAGRIRQYPPQERLQGRTLELVGVYVQKWPESGRSGEVNFVIRDSRDYLIASGRTEGLGSPNTRTRLEVFHCTFLADRDTLVPPVGAGWFVRSFPHISGNWTEIAKTRSDFYEVQEESRASVKRSEERIEILGVVTRTSSLGAVVPLAILALLGYMSTLMRQIRKQNVFSAWKVDDTSEMFLSPWFCTNSDVPSVVLSVLSLVIAPAACAALSIGYFATSAHSEAVQIFVCLGVAVLGSTVVLQGVGFQTASRGHGGKQSVNNRH